MLVEIQVKENKLSLVESALGDTSWWPPTDLYVSSITAHAQSPGVYGLLGNTPSLYSFFGPTVKDINISGVEHASTSVS